MSMLKNKHDKVIYEGRIRSGVNGMESEKSYQVKLNKEINLMYLDPFPCLDGDFYSSTSYREKYNNSSNIADYYSSYDQQHTERVSKLEISSLRGRAVGDIGCGGGSFLDLISGVAEKTYAIEPAQFYHNNLKKNGHKVYSFTDDLYLTEGCCLDICFSFHVIEHVVDPIKFLKNIVKCCKPGASISIITPNNNDIMLKIGEKSFEKFYYREAHLWYFSLSSLKYICNAVGLEFIGYKYIHNYDISNIVNWLIEKKPTGNDKNNKIFTSSFNNYFKLWVEEAKMADEISVEFKVTNK